MKGLIPLSLGLLALLALMATARSWEEPGASVKIDMSRSDKNSTEYVVTITGTRDGETSFRGFHLKAENVPPVLPAPKLFPLAEDSIDILHEGQTVGALKAIPTKDGVVHLKVIGALLKDGTYRFRIPWSGAPPDAPLGAARATVTSNGDLICGPSDVIGEDQVSEGACVPLTTVALTGPGPEEDTLTCPAGQTTSLRIVVDESWAGRSFEIHSSLSVNPDRLDTVGVGINSVAEPVPSEWGLGFTGFAGEIAPDGGSAEPVTIAIPDDPDLRGATFYVVLALKDEASREVVLTSDLLTAVVP